MPVNQNPRGALPARFRRQRVLIVGCGDVGQRVARQWLPAVGINAKTANGNRLAGGGASKNIATTPAASQRLRGPLVRALTSSPGKCAALRALGVVPLLGNLDEPASLRRLAGIAQRVIHLAPPKAVVGDGAAAGTHDGRTQALLRALVRCAGAAPKLVYGSTSGVYGDWQGARVAETNALRATTGRALRRVSAEQQLRTWGLRFAAAGARVHLLRIPGIYAGDREGGTPVARLLRGTPVLQVEDDVYTSHIHADDLARAVVRALWHGKPQRISNVADNTDMRMGDYFALAATLWQLPAPPRISRAEAQQALSPTLLSFMSESRRLSNARMRLELGVRLRYPTVHEGLRAAVALGKATLPADAG